MKSWKRGIASCLLLLSSATVALARGEDPLVGSLPRKAINEGHGLVIGLLDNLVALLAALLSLLT